SERDLYVPARSSRCGLMPSPDRVPVNVLPIRSSRPRDGLNNPPRLWPVTRLRSRPIVLHNRGCVNLVLFPVVCAMRPEGLMFVLLLCSSVCFYFIMI